MAIKDFFRRKKPEKAPLPEEKKVKEEGEVKKEDRTKKPERKKISESWRVLKSPHVTERASELAGKNDYVFKVFNRANKKEVKEAVERVFGVDVIDVKIINVSSKKRRLGRIQGRRPGYKKAIARIKKGQKIEILPR